MKSVHIHSSIQVIQFFRSIADAFRTSWTKGLVVTGCCLLSVLPLIASEDIDPNPANFWAFQAPVFHAESESGIEAESENEGVTWIDPWVSAEIKSRNLQPNPRARRSTLIRRLYLDLTGLLPTPQETLQFVNNSRSDSEAWQALVDQVLASPAFGERWGRHWLDVARYAESVGRTRNYPLPHAWKYRDYVIDSFNQDLPFDQFIREQIAGDLLPADSAEESARGMVATGFLALGSHDLNERNNRQFEMDVVDEQIDVITRGFMALTVACARCHDHKFDPIPTKDYYAMAGILRSSDLRIGYSNRQGGQNAFNDIFLAQLPGKENQEIGEKSAEDKSKKQIQLEKQLHEQESKLKELQRFRFQLNKFNNRPLKRTQVLEEIAAAGLTPKKLNKEFQQIRRSIPKLKRELEQEIINSGGMDIQATLETHALGLVDDSKPVDCPVHIRGDIDQLGEKVPRGFIQVLNPSSEPALNMPSDQSGRVELADWIASRQNPLTSRVIANRVWGHLMGRGIVRTVDNFGVTGEPPTHPELLDNLAVYLMENRWSIKSLIRLIVTSQTYQRSSDNHMESYGVDPENVYYWRMSPKRLEAEALRDTMLHVSGLLLEHKDRPSPVAALDPKELNLRQVSKVVGFETFRERSVYLPTLRGFLPDIYEVFDFPDPSQVMGDREVTTVATQALYLMNHPVVMTLADAAARRLDSLVSEDNVRQQARRIYFTALCRAPTQAEINRTIKWIQSAPKGSSRQEVLSQVFQAFFAGAEFRYVW